MRPTATSLLLLERWHQCGSWVFIYGRRGFVTNHDKVFIANDQDRGVLSSFFFKSNGFQAQSGVFLFFCRFGAEVNL